MRLAIIIAAFAMTACSAEYIAYLRERDAAEAAAHAEAWRKMTPCQQCEMRRLGCEQGQGFDDSARAIAGLPPLPRRQCADCATICAMEE